MKLFSNEETVADVLASIMEPIGGAYPTAGTTHDIQDTEPEDKKVDDIPEELKKVTSFSDKLFNDVKGIMGQEPDLSIQAYFKSHKVNTVVSYSLDSGGLGPNANTMFGPGFEGRYTKQLANILEGEGLNEAYMIELISLYGLINKRQYPIHLSSKKYVRLLPKIVMVLNKFFNEYRPVLRGMYTMFASNIQAKQDRQEADIKEKGDNHAQA